jgi:hypothetical protein
MASRWILRTVLLTTGCATMADMAREQASRELRCPAETIAVTPRTDLNPHGGILDVEACGKVARYAVVYREALCIREPDPDPADLDAFKAAPRPSRPR